MYIRTFKLNCSVGSLTGYQDKLRGLNSTVPKAAMPGLDTASCLFPCGQQLRMQEAQPIEVNDGHAGVYCLKRVLRWHLPPGDARVTVQKQGYIAGRDLSRPLR